MANYGGGSCALSACWLERDEPVTAPTIDAVDVILRDGGTMRLEPPAASDADALVEPLLESDWSERGALVGRLGGDAESRVVAVASYVRINETDVAEMAFAVADSEQERGIGTRLLEQLARRARAHGITRFVADVLSSNALALTVFDDAGFRVAGERDAGEVELRFPIAKTPEFEAQVERRDRPRFEERA